MHLTPSFRLHLGPQCQEEEEEEERKGRRKKKKKKKLLAYKDKENEGRRQQ